MSGSDDQPTRAEASRDAPPAAATQPGRSRQVPLGLVALLVVLVVGAGFVAFKVMDRSTSSAASGASASGSSTNGRGKLTPVTDPPGFDGPVVGTNTNGKVAKVVDKAKFCTGYERFQAYRTAYLERLTAATDRSALRTWVSANAKAGETAASEMSLGLGVNAGDIGMLPWTFVVDSDERFHRDYDLAEMRTLAAESSARLSGYDAAAASVC